MADDHNGLGNRRPQQLGAMYRDLSRGFDSQTDFVALDFDYARPEIEIDVVAKEAGVDNDTATSLVKIGETARNLKGHGLDEGISTRLLVYAASLIKDGIPAHDACEMALVSPITDDADIRSTLIHAIDAVFG